MRLKGEGEGVGEREGICFNQVFFGGVEDEPEIEAVQGGGLHELLRQSVPVWNCSWKK